MTEEHINEYYGKRNLRKYTDYTITDLNKLKKELEPIRENGIAYDINEHTLGASSIGAGIRDINGNTVAAVIVIGPSIRLPYKRLRTIMPDVKRCAAEISHSIGWKGK